MQRARVRLIQQKMGGMREHQPDRDPGDSESDQGRQEAYHGGTDITTTGLARRNVGKLLFVAILACT